MAGAAQTFVREPGAQSPEDYARRVQRLAQAYLGLLIGSLIGIALLVWRAQYFVALSQRSNVETLTLAFFLVFFGYIAVLSVGGARGSLIILRYELARRRAKDKLEVERQMMRSLGPSRGGPPIVALNRLLERESGTGEAFDLQIADEGGSMGSIHVDGAEVSHYSTVRDGSNTALAYFVHQVNAVLGLDSSRGLDVVQWQKIDDESTSQYLCMVQFARNLERKLGADELWPRVTLTHDHLRELERRMTAICPALRSEGFLPDWEYAGEHKLPIVPEPLGLISLSRSERRVDPLASMGCAVFVVFAVVAILAIFIVFPPWVPGV
jgi:hypothetical protein